MRTRIWVTSLALAIGIGLAGVASAAEQEGAVDEILQVLKDRGLVDEGEYNRLAAKNAAYEKQQDDSWASKFDFWGDFRFRHESFWFNKDDVRNRGNRYRIRYRFRLNGKVDVNEWASVYFRFASGDDDDRSTNQTLGSGVDFDTDDLRLDLAYAQLRAPSEWVPLPNGKAVLELGKVKNPFYWKAGKDFMLWDHDITFEGVTGKLSTKPTEATTLKANFGYYIIDENSSSRDPHFWGLQGIVDHELNENIVVGARATWYEFRSIDPAFNVRGATALGATSSGGGNIIDGLNGDIAGQDFSVIEVGGYARYNGIENWPILAWFNWAQNLDAQSSALFSQAGKEDTAWSAGVEIGDKKKFVKIGAGYWKIEANAFPAMFVDSDLFDGRTNREGPAVYLSRQLIKNTDLNVTLFYSDSIEDDLPAFATSERDSDRYRLQSDLVFKF